jgi:hypothetical protein
MQHFLASSYSRWLCNASHSILHENELVASEIAALGCHADLRKSALVIEIEDLFRPSYFEGIAADQIDNVVPQRHPSKGLVIPKRIQRPAREGVLEQAFPPQLQARRPKNQKAKVRRKAVIGLLDRSPPTASFPLVVIDGDKEGASQFDDRLHIFQSLPHGTSMMQNAPGIDNVELPQAP